MRRPTLADMLPLLAVGAIWGSSFLAIEAAVAEVPPLGVAAASGRRVGARRGGTP